MDHLWTPWRYGYVTGADPSAKRGVPKSLAGWTGDHGCVFCNMVAAADHAIAAGMDRDQAECAAGIVLRAAHCFICLNAFPYTSGHVMVVPFSHLDRLALLEPAAAHEMIDLGQRIERALGKLYSPDGFNFGMNIGQAAGAGVAGHVHLHAMPRWVGDTSFITSIGETRIVPETLDTTWKRLRQAFAETDPA